MATIKSFTDISQSKKLAEILPLESADAFYIVGKKPVDIVPIYGSVTHQHLIEQMAYKRAVPCWSLAALFGILTENKICHYDDRYYCQYMNEGSEFPAYSTAEYDNPVDACVAMIEKLHELNLL